MKRMVLFTLLSISMCVSFYTQCAEPSDDLSISKAGFSPDGKTIAVISGKDVLLFNERGSGKRSLWHMYPVSQVIFSPDGELLATVSKAEVAIFSVSGRKKSSKWFMSNIDFIRFSPDSSTILVYMEKDSFWKAYLISASSGREIATLW